MPRPCLTDKPPGSEQQNCSIKDDQKLLGKETGDSGFWHATSNKEELKKVSEQKTDFIKYVISKKTTLIKPSDNAVPTTAEPWDYKPDINCILKSVEEEENDALLDGCSLSAGSDGDHFYKVYSAKSPSAVRAASLLDELVALREELSGRIKELAMFKQDVREAGRMIRDSSQDKVELATHRIESLCSQLDHANIS